MISLLRRVLPVIPPQSIATLLGVSSLPPKDFTILTESTESSLGSKAGILDVFLSCISKALTLQVKAKHKEGKNLTAVTLATSIHPRGDNPIVGELRWWIRGSMTKKIAEEIIRMLKDLSNDGLGNQDWISVTKGAIAENILHLTKLENRSEPQECLKNPTLWLALASLCVLDQSHVEGLSSGDYKGASSDERPTCDNHDDGETLAIIGCDECGNLCADCDRFLHLHRKTRAHQRQIFKVRLP